MLGEVRSLAIATSLSRSLAIATSLSRSLAIAMSFRRGFTMSQRATSVALLEAKVLRERVGGLVLGVGAIGATERL